MHCLPFSLFCSLLSPFLADCCPLDSTEPLFWTVSPIISFWRNHLSSLGLPYYPHQHWLNPLSPPVLRAAPWPPHLLYLFDKDKLYLKKKKTLPSLHNFRTPEQMSFLFPTNVETRVWDDPWHSASLAYSDVLSFPPNFLFSWGPKLINFALSPSLQHMEDSY